MAYNVYHNSISQHALAVVYSASLSTRYHKKRVGLHSNLVGVSNFDDYLAIQHTRYRTHSHRPIFAARRYALAWLLRRRDFCLSVRLSHSWTVTKRVNISSIHFHRRQLNFVLHKMLH